ncbi:MAG TPA: hypothetical protein VGR40_10805, partial [Candidatus Binatus sp.]|nr:hypothetical protein [Candidatus Binatus sp.]
ATPGQLTQDERQSDAISGHKMAANDTFFGSPASYYYNLDARDEVAIARALDLPILILHGGRDYKVSDDDFAYWQSGLKGDDKLRTATLPPLNHLLIAGQGPTTQAEYFASGHVDVGVIGTIAGFIANPAGATVSQASN